MARGTEDQVNETHSTVFTYMIPIEKNIPMPDRPARPSKYPFDLMEIGDSFFVTDSHLALRQAVIKKQRKSNMRFTVRAVDGGYRCWRVK